MEDQIEQHTMCLVELKNGIRGAVFGIQEGNNLVGRWDPDTSSFPDIDLEAADPDVKVSRKHAIIERKGNSAEIEDLNSLNGTFINRGQRLRAGIRHQLSHGDEIIIGKTFLVFEVAS